jgi:hypothetical protein
MKSIRKIAPKGLRGGCGGWAISRVKDKEEVCLIFKDTPYFLNPDVS